MATRARLQKKLLSKQLQTCDSLNPTEKAVITPEIDNLLILLKEMDQIDKTLISAAIQCIPSNQVGLAKNSVKNTFGLSSRQYTIVHTNIDRFEKQQIQNVKEKQNTTQISKTEAMIKQTDAMSTNEANSNVTCNGRRRFQPNFY